MWKKRSCWRFLITTNFKEGLSLWQCKTNDMDVIYPTTNWVSCQGFMNRK
jgi:hypothetical protein